MNEVLVDNTYGRDHVERLIEEAQQERLARQVIKANRRRNRVQRLKTFVTNIIK